jgi:hypothetical protein
MLPICLLFSFLSIGQKTVDIIIPKDDGSPFKEPIKYLWEGKNNRITSNYMGDFRIIKVWTDNGNIDSGDYYLTDYAITPQRTGIVNV